MGFPHGRRKTTTLVAGLRMTGMIAPMVLDGPINGEWFEAYVRQVFVPELRHGDILIMDNLSNHKARFGARPDRGCWRNNPLPANVQFRIQNCREGVRPAQGLAMRSRRAHRLRAVQPYR